MQARIDSFFKPPAARSPGVLPPGDASLNPAGKTHVEALVTYKRRHQVVETCKESQLNEEKEKVKVVDVDQTASVEKSNMGKTLNKKRSYAQCFLELGQPDFLLHRCSTCGMKYARGDEDDEKLHRSFHDTCLRGIPFKGWCNERVIYVDKDTGDRIILVLDGDPSTHKHKVLQLSELLERDLGLSNGWLLLKHCKVYIFISSNRITGCVFAEAIKTARRLISSKITSNSINQKSMALTGSTHNTLKFGTLNFVRESVRKISSASAPEGVILCEEESVRAKCGIRAIWVAPSKRRQGIASKLLDSVRENFAVEPSGCAFSQPTSAGKVFASAYFRTESFLVYNPNQDL